MPIINSCTDIYKLSFPPGYNYGVFNSINQAAIGAARGLIVLNDLKLKLVDMKVSEVELLRVLALPDLKFLGTWQKTQLSGPIEILFDVDKAQFIYTNTKGFPVYDSGLYMIKEVFITAIFVQPHCCDGYFHVPYMDAIYSCITKQEIEPEIPPFKECTYPINIGEPTPIPTSPPISFPMC